MFTTILFDLDGTLCDSFPGVSNSIEYALKRLGYERPPEGILRKCLGPPLMESFTKLLGLSEEQAKTAVKLYREYYPQKGIYEQSLMEGAEETLKALKAKGKTVCLATSKPQEYSERILKHFGVEKYFDVITGATFDGTLSEKPDIIARVLQKTGAQPAECLMVGDRYFDIAGAHACKVRCAAVLCGYGSEQEFREYNADFIVNILADIIPLADQPSFS